MAETGGSEPGQSPRVTSLPSLPYASKSVVQFLGPPNLHFTQFGDTKGEGEHDTFDTYYPKVRPPAQVITPAEKDLKFDPYTGLSATRIERDPRPRKAVGDSPEAFNDPAHNLYQVNKALSAVCTAEGSIQQKDLKTIIEGVGVHNATPYVEHILYHFDGQGEGSVGFMDLLQALDLALNGEGKMAAREQCFNLFDEYLCHYILKCRLLELKGKRREANGQTHLMIKNLLLLIDELEKEEDEKAAASAGKGKKKKGGLPPVTKFINKMQISLPEFSYALERDPMFVMCFLPPLFMTLKTRREKKKAS